MLTHLAGQAVGVVLSGGGSRGLAHLGVLRALDDAGVPIDVVGGVSQVNANMLFKPYICFVPASIGCQAYSTSCLDVHVAL